MMVKEEEYSLGKKFCFNLKGLPIICFDIF
jgi:hypothetical protein